MALCCDIRIASDDARFALPEVNLGYIPSAGGTQTLPRNIAPGIAREMVYSGEPIDAQRALAVGLVNRVVPRERLQGEAESLAARLAGLNPAVVAGVKEAIAVGADLSLEQGLRLEGLIATRLRTGAARDGRSA
jgi:enoyl-CoA hydratase